MNPPCLLFELDARSSWLTVACVGALLLATQSKPSAAEVVDASLWGTDGIVYAMARAGNTIYLGGAFMSIGPNTGGGVPLSANTGRARTHFPRVAGTVYAAIPDGSGGWYIGGEFVAVGGVPRLNLAHVLADGTVGPWSPTASGTPVYAPTLPLVVCLAKEGSTVYVGGDFQTLSGEPRRNLGAVDAVSGAVLDWAPEPDHWVTALATQGGVVYAGGLFTHMGGQSRNYVAAVDVSSGAVTDWNPNAEYWVEVLVPDGEVVYAGGYFTRIGGQVRNRIAALDAASGMATEWDPNALGPDFELGTYVKDIVVEGGTVYVAGSFDHIGGEARGSVAALDARSGAATAWNPALGPRYPGYPPPPVLDVELHGGRVYIGGGFRTVDGVVRLNLASFEAATGALTEWNPGANGGVYALAAWRGTVYAGGEFGMVGTWQARQCLAAVDATTGELKPWNPDARGGLVFSLAASGGQVYVGGTFTSLGGQPRNNLGAVDTLAGAPTGWNPGANNSVDALLVHEGVVYAGGYFTALGGQVRRYVGAVDAETGLVTGWNPDPSRMVFAMAAYDRTIYLGGFFSQVGGLPRRYLAAVDAETGAVSPWDPQAEAGGWVRSLAVTGTTVYAGGAFDRMGGQVRNGLAAVDRTTGSVTSWDPARALVHPDVKALLVQDGTLYVGGDFERMGGQPRICLAAVDTITGAATAWDPGANGYVWSLLGRGDVIYAGGGFTRLGGWPCAGLAAFADSARRPAVVPRVRPVALAPVAPNPARSSAKLRFALAAPAAVDLAVFDVQGRRVATVLDHDRRSAGVHEVAIDANGWPEGLYVCRLDARGYAATRKMLVVR
jgi:predicted small secreted protein